MNIQDLQNQLRIHIRTRIGRKELTGRGLARDAGFPQGHLSNFLNQRRGLSTESMDRLLQALGIELLDLVSTQDIQRRALLPPSTKGMASVAMVAPENAALARFTAAQILQTFSFSQAFLRRLRPNHGGDRGDWLRFVVVRLDARSGGDVLASSVSCASLLIDRHYNSLQPYRRLQPNLYLATFSGQCRIGYLSVFDGHLLLRPRDPAREMEVTRIPRGQTFAEYVIGRVCHVGQEL